VAKIKGSLILIIKNSKQPEPHILADLPIYVESCEEALKLVAEIKQQEDYRCGERTIILLSEIPI